MATKTTVKLVARKFEGDDAYSWAIFRASDVKGMGSIIMWGQAKPFYSGLSRSQVDYYKKMVSEKLNAQS